MVTRSLWWAAAGALLVVAGCDTPTVGTDGGDGGGSDASDACEGLTLCTTAGTSCDGDSLVTCVANADGCLVETTAACDADQTCDDSGATAECVDVDPCDAIPAAERCATEGRSCDGDTLTICSANTDGCLVLEATDCAASPGGVCDESGTMPMCVLPVDPCAGIADACTTEGTSCDGTSLVTCAPDALGCLVETSVDCASRAGGTCGGAPAECSFTGDPCEGITQCAASGTSCDGPELVACAEDAFGCLIETRTDCTDTMFGFCDVDGAPAACSTAASDPCMGVTECGTEPSRGCSTDGANIEECSANAFGCFVAETTSCDTGDVCSAASGMAICVDVCSLVDTCPSATYCAGEELVTCAADSNGCLVETGRVACEAPETCNTTMGACVDSCPSAAPTILNCDSGTVDGNTAMGSSVNPGNYGSCYDGTSYGGAEQYWRFLNDRTGRMEVTIASTRVTTTRDLDLFVLDAGDGTTACSADTLSCLGGSRLGGGNETVTFVADAGDLAYVVYDLFSTPTTDTAEYTLAITCRPLVCGDGIVAGDEACDDGNTTAGDGCSATCTVEPPYGCGGEPSVCYVAGLNGTCAMAAVITGNAARNGEEIADGGPRPMDASCGSGGGAVALYYSVTVPPGTRVDATTDSSEDLVVFTQDACADTTCTYASDFPESAFISNTGTTTITRIVGVRRYGTTTTGTFDIDFTYNAIAMNAGCAGATPLGTGITGADLNTGGTPPAGTNCGSSDGPVLYYSVTVPANSRTTVTGTSTGTLSWDLTLRSLDDCSGACVASVDASSSAAESIVLTNTTASDVTRLIAVGADSATTFGTFDLSSTTVAFAANATCAGATPIGTGVTGADLRVGGGPRPTGTNCGTSAGPVLYYSVTVPANSRTTVTGTSTGTPTWDLTLRSLDDCSGACLANVDASSSAAETIVFTNTTASDITRLIAVGADSASTFGTFDLSSTTVAFAANATCAGAAPIGAGVTGADVRMGGPRPTGTNCGSSVGPVLYYSVTVPANSRTTVTGTSTGTPSWDLTLRSLDDCSGVCLASVDASSSAAENIVLTNTTASDVTRLIAVGADSASTFGTFNLSSTTVALAANASCAGAAALGAGVTGVDLRNGGPRPTGTNCASSAGPVLYYSVSVPANSTTTVTATATGTTWDPTLRSVADCSGSCLAHRDATGGVAETISFTNATGSAVTRVFAVGADSTTNFGTFDLSAASAPITYAANASCATATAIGTATPSVTAQDTAGGGASPAGATCASSGTQTLYYAVTVPAGQVATIDVDGASAFDAVVMELDSCAATDCLDSTDGPGDGGVETVIVDNSAGASSVVRIIAVNEYISDEVGAFDLDVTYVDPPYLHAPITAACVTAGTWTPLSRSSATGNDSTTPITALPFAFSYFGAAVTHFSTNDNGIAQLWSSSTGTPDDEWTNARLPSTSAPNGVVAAFWDDVYLGGAYAHRVQTVGTAGSQVLVIEWSDALAGSGGSPLTFQAHFYEGTNVIEYHYCSVGTGTRASGDSATIGLENLAGTDGVTVSHNTAGAVVAGGGYRLTPD